MEITHIVDLGLTTELGAYALVVLWEYYQVAI